MVGSDGEAENNAPALIKLPVYLRGGKEPSGDNKKQDRTMHNEKNFREGTMTAHWSNLQRKLSKELGA